MTINTVCLSHTSCIVFMIMNELLYCRERMLLNQVVQSFGTCLLDVVMLRYQVPTNVTSQKRWHEVCQHQFLPLSNANIIHKLISDHVIMTHINHTHVMMIMLTRFYILHAFDQWQCLLCSGFGFKAELFEINSIYYHCFKHMKQLLLLTPDSWQEESA